MLLDDRINQTAARLARLREEWRAWRSADRPTPPSAGWSALSLPTPTHTRLRAVQRVVDSLRVFLELPATRPTLVTEAEALAGPEGVVFIEAATADYTLTLAPTLDLDGVLRLIHTTGAYDVQVDAAVGEAVWVPGTGDVTGTPAARTLSTGDAVLIVPEPAQARVWYVVL